MKTRILPTVGKQYIARKDDVVVEVVGVARHYLGDIVVEFIKASEANTVPMYRYNLDCFWANYKVMEGEDD